MEGMISLKDFILGVKKELQEASSEGSKSPYLQLNQVELEAEFGLDTTASAEGGFKFLVKVAADVGATQLHRVKLIFSPLSTENPVYVAVPPADSEATVDDSTFNISLPPITVGRGKQQPGLYFQLPGQFRHDSSGQISPEPVSQGLGNQHPDKNGS